MARNINITGKQAERINITGKPLERIDPQEFAAALGAELCGERMAGELDPISLLTLGNELIKRLRSTGGRPALVDATQKCKVPLSPQDIAALEKLCSAIESETGAKTSLGQIASVLLRLQLDTLVEIPAASPGQKSTSPSKQVEEGRSLKLLRGLLEEQLQPIREELKRLAREVHKHAK